MLRKETLLTTIDHDKMMKCDTCNRGVNKVWWIKSNRYCAYCINIEITNTNRGKDPDTMRCDGCGMHSGVLFKTDDKSLCRKCRRESRPVKHDMKMIDGFITMNLAELDCGGLFNIDMGRREYYKTVKELQKCGWFLKEEKSFLKGSKEFDDLGYKAAYKLLYTGNKKCRRFPSMCWPINYVHCDDNLCSGGIGAIIGC